MCTFVAEVFIAVNFVVQNSLKESDVKFSVQNKISGHQNHFYIKNLQIIEKSQTGVPYVFMLSNRQVTSFSLISTRGLTQFLNYVL